jgi:hypothetical protein
MAPPQPALFGPFLPSQAKPYPTQQQHPEDSEMGTKSSEDGAVMKRFVVFAFYWYYPSGGMGDLRGSVDSIEEAKALILQMGGFGSCDEADVVDRDTWKAVASWSRDTGWGERS